MPVKNLQKIKNLPKKFENPTIFPIILALSIRFSNSHSKTKKIHFSQLIFLNAQPFAIDAVRSNEKDQLKNKK